MNKTRLNAKKAEAWQIAEIRAGIADLDAGRIVSHEKVTKWLKSWGKPGETRAPVVETRPRRSRSVGQVDDVDDLPSSGLKD